MLAILNHNAGSAGDGSEQDIVRAFEDEGVSLQIERLGAERSLEELTKTARESADQIVVAGGGDGTISAVAGMLAGTEKILGVLPLGTLNHFAKDLGIPLDLTGAIETIVHGRMTQTDVAEVNGHVFINNSSLGLYPQIVTDREAQQERLARSKWAAFFWASLRVFRRFPFLDLRLSLEGKALVRRTAFLFVGNNEYEIAGFNLGARRCLNAGRLGLYLTHRTGRLGLLRLGLNAILGRVRRAKDFESFCVEEATIATRRRHLLVSADGEVTTMTAPLHYRIRPRALRVMVPAPKEP